jgi:hypothetical protein
MYGLVAMTRNLSLFIPSRIGAFPVEGIHAMEADGRSRPTC